MPCEHCRKAIAANPAAPGDNAEAHAADCADCGAFLNEMRSLDADIARALAIDVPELRMPELPPVQSGAAGSGVSELPGRRSARPAAWRRPALLTGLAAGIALVALVSLLVPRADGPELTLAEEVVAHMDHEEASRRVTSVAVPESKLKAVVAPQVSELGGDVGLVTYARNCVIRGNTVPHLVVQGERGPITLILLPDERIEQPVPLAGENVHGLILPVGSGSVAIIGEREDQLDEVRATGRRVAASMQWRLL